jgi:SLT domain-containing protein
MVPIGKNIVAGMIKGILDAASVSNLGHLIGDIFGGWPQALGRMIEKGFISASHLPAKAWGALKGAGLNIWHALFGGGGGAPTTAPFTGNVGVAQWAPVVARALSMLGLPLSLESNVLYQMQTESGGNPRAINLTDINAQMGDPSRGLMQVIESTFAAYHVPGTSMDIYDPLANIAAALNYARARYGPTLMSGGMGVGSGHGYDSGGWLPTGLTMAYNNTGSPELVLSHSQLAGMKAASGGPTYIAHFDSLTGQAIEGHVQSAFIAMNIREGHLARVGRRQ